MPIYSDLGNFELGSVFLGATLGIALQDESLTLADAVANTQSALEGESITFSESLQIILTHETENLGLTDEIAALRIGEFETISMVDAQEATYGSNPSETMGMIDSEMANFGALEDESLLLTELHQYLNIGYAGVIARIVLAIDITSEDICGAIREAGHSIFLGDALTPARAFLFPKQSIQKFNENKTIYPGDAVMFTCPDLTIYIGDYITHNFIKYRAVTAKDAFIGGNHIYRKWFLRRVVPMTMLQKVLGLTASANREGKTTLSWEPINNQVYTHLDRYIVKRILGELPPKYTDVLMLSNTPPIAPVAGGKYVVGPAPTGAWTGQRGKIATWTGTIYTFVVVGVGVMIFDQGSNDYLMSYDSGGGIIAWTEVPWEIMEATKNNSFTDRTLTPNVKYTFCVMARDMYNNFGPESDCVTPATDTVPPATPGGVR